MDLSLVIPCYNEAGNLPRVFETMARVMPDDLSMEVVFVDNGSTDDSPALFAQLLPLHPFARGIRVDVNQGYGHGILAGLGVTSGAIVGWTHADMQTDPADVVNAYRAARGPLLAGRTVVKGRRRGRPLFDRVFTGGMSLFASAMLGARLRDVNAQPKLFPRPLLADMGLAPQDFSLDLYWLWLAMRKGYAVVEYPVHFGIRTAGVAKGGGDLKGKYRLTRRTAAFVTALRRDIRAGRR